MARSSCQSLSNLLRNTPSTNHHHHQQRISFSVRIRQAALPLVTESHVGLPWIHVDLLPGAPLSETLDYRFRPYSVHSNPLWRFQTKLWFDQEFDELNSDIGPDSFEDIYFPIDIPSIACLDLIGCLHCLDSIVAGYAPTAQHTIAHSQAEDDYCGEDDNLHKKTPKFTQWEPLWMLKVAGNSAAKFESLTANSDSKFSKTTLKPPSNECLSKPINVLRFVMNSARRQSPPENISSIICDNAFMLQDDLLVIKCDPQLSSTNLEPQAKKSKLKLKTGSETNIESSSAPKCPRKTSKMTVPKSNNNGPNLEMLPPEIVFQIIDVVPGGPHHQLRTLLCLCGVSRRLRTICSDPSLFKWLDLKGAHGYSQRLTPQVVSFLGAKSPYDLEALRLSWLPFLHSKQVRLELLVRQCENLQTVIAQSCPLIDDDFLRALCRSPAAETLTTLDLSSCWSISRRGFGCLDALECVKNLSLAHTMISQKTLDILLCAMGPRLEVLNLGFLSGISNMDAVCSVLAENTPNLVALDLSDSVSLTNVGLEKLGKGCPKLEELVLWHCSLLATLSVTELAPLYWPKLRRLIIHVSDVVNLEIFATEAEKMPLLEQLSVICFRRGGAPITILQKLLTAFPKLTYLRVPIDWPVAAEFEESRLMLSNLRRTHPNCAIQTQ